MVIGAGGTGGHLLPGLLVARALRRRGAEAIFYGRDGPGATDVEEAGFPFVGFRVRGARRPFWHPGNAAVAGAMAGAIAGAARRLRRERPECVLSIGGYASLPAALGAVVARRPLVLFEPNARAGLANRVCRPFARAVAVPFAEFGAALGSRAVAVGPLVRPELWAGRPSAEASAAMGVPPNRLVVGLFGGSQGARRLNDALLDCYDAWRRRDDLAVIQVAGAGQVDAVRRRLDGLRRANDSVVWNVVGYANDMASFYSASDVVVCRAGASSLAEVLATGTPAVMVPGAFAEGHQRDNARVAAAAGAAVMIEDADLDGARLRAEVEALLADPPRRAAMSAAGRALAGPPGAAADRIADLALEVA